MNKMKILVTFANVWKMDTGNSGMTLNYFMFGENGELITRSRIFLAVLSDSSVQNVLYLRTCVTKSPGYQASMMQRCQ